MELLVGILFALAGLVTGGIAWYRARADKDSTIVTTATEMAERLVKTAGALVTPLELRVTELGHEVAALKATVEGNVIAMAAMGVKVEECERSRVELMARNDRLETELERVKAQLGGRRNDDPENGD